MFSLLIAFFAIFCAVTNAATHKTDVLDRDIANIEGLTNAQRLARGLPVGPVKFGRTLPGYAQVRKPTSVSAEKRAPASSGTPPLHFSGRIEVRSTSGSVEGYVRNWNSAASVSGVNYGGPDEELHVNFYTTPSGSGPVNILTTNPNFPPPYYIGTSTNATLSVNSANIVGFNNVAETPAGSPPLSIDGQEAESSIWSINPNTGEIKAQYVNTDGSYPRTLIFYDIRENAIFFGGDINAYNKEHVDTPASVVKFYLAAIAN